MDNLNPSVEKETGIIIVGPGKVGRNILSTIHSLSDILVIGGMNQTEDSDLSTLDALVRLKTKEVEELMATLQDQPRDNTLILQEQEKRNSKAGSKFFTTNHHHNTKPRTIPKKSFQSRKK